MRPTATVAINDLGIRLQGFAPGNRLGIERTLERLGGLVTAGR